MIWKMHKSQTHLLILLIWGVFLLHRVNAAETSIVGKFENIEGYEDMNGNPIWVVGTGFEFLPNGKVLVQVYYNENHGSAKDPPPPDYSLNFYYYTIVAPHELLVFNSRRQQSRWHYWWKDGALGLETGGEPRYFKPVKKFLFEDQLRQNLLTHTSHK